MANAIVNTANTVKSATSLLVLAGVAGVGIYAYIKIRDTKNAILDAREFVTKKINPMDKENLVNQSVEKVVGKENLATAGDNFFSAVDWFAERVGFEKGIDGVKGQPIWEQKEDARRAGNHATRKTGKNSNG